MCVKSHSRITDTMISTTTNHTQIDLSLPWSTTMINALTIDIEETVAELPGLARPGTMKCCQGLLPAFGLRFTPHIQRKTRTDLRLRPHPVDTLLHLAIAPVAPLHGIRGGGQQLVIEKRQGLF